MSEWTAVRLAPGLFLFVLAEGGALRRAAFARSEKDAPPGFVPAQRNDGEPVLVQARRELEEYAQGVRKRFTVPFELEGTHFQCEVWKALFEIPCVETHTYGEIARAMGRSCAARAVGASAGKNPLPVIVPCHRLVGAGGRLGGFSGGPGIKEQLLAMEGCLPGRR
jgi:O-6-methylguanine DNA methyltransferase